ncbi:MAG: peptidylprolyl isomerase [Rhizobiales bacterium]|nr:peptidylprolyl isomerase [Hyphomicrobiales bacterium]
MWAQEESPVVATIGDLQITEADIALAEADFAGSLEQYPEAQRRTILIDVMINLTLLASAAEASEISQTPEFIRRLNYVRLRALRDLYFEQEIETQITPEAIEAAYQAQIANVPIEVEIHARHILVETEDEAKALVEALEGGADFEELAQEKSTGPSGANGGDLGFFGENDMVPAFGTVAFSLEDGEISAPVQTQFGWHVIKVEERRNKELPALEAVSSQVRDVLIRERFAEVIANLKAASTVTIVPNEAEAGSDDAEAGGEEQPAAE